MCCSRKYLYPYHERFFWDPHHSRKSQLKLHTKDFGLETPSPLEFPVSLLRVGTDIFWKHTPPPRTPKKETAPP